MFVCLFVVVVVVVVRFNQYPNATTDVRKFSKLQIFRNFLNVLNFLNFSNCENSGFRRGVVVVFALPGCYAE